MDLATILGIGFGGTEVLIVCGVIVLLFGGAAIPKFARNIGKAKKEFEQGLKDSQKAGKTEDEEETQKKDESE